MKDIPDQPSDLQMFQEALEDVKKTDGNPSPETNNFIQRLPPEIKAAVNQVLIKAVLGKYK